MKEDNIDDNLITDLVDWENPPTVSDLKSDIYQASGVHSEHIANVDNWLMVLRGKLNIPTVEGRSRVQPKTARVHSEWKYPSLENPLLSSPDLFDISPSTHADVQAAKQNEQILNKQFRSDIPRVKFINSYVRTAVNTGTVIVKVGWDTRTGLTYQEYEVPVYAETQEQKLAFLEQQVADGVLSQDIAIKLAQSEEPIIIDVKKEVREVEDVIFNGPTLEVKDSRNVIIDPTCMGDISKANFIVDTYASDLSTLRKDGRYSNLEFVNANVGSMTSSDVPNVYEYNISGFEYLDEPRKKVLVHEYWGYWDINNTGIVEPIMASFIGDVMIRLEKNPFPDKKLPFVLVQYMPSTDLNSIYGESDASLIEDNQTIIGAITRGVLDMFGRHANAQQGIAKGLLDEVNLKRFRAGEDYLFNPQLGNLNNAFVQSQYPDFPKGAFDLLTMQKTEAQEITGTIPFAGGQYGGSNGNSVGGIETALDATAKREVNILQRLSQGLIDIGNKIVSMNALWLTDGEIIRITDNEFIAISKSTLSGKFDLNISISTAEQDAAKSNQLAFLLQTIGNNSDFGILKMMYMKIADLNKMPDLVKALEEYEPQPDPMAQQLQQMQMELLAAQIETEKSKAIENYAQIERTQAQTAKELAQAKHLQSNTDKIDLDFMEQATGVAHDRELEKLKENKADKVENKPTAKKGRTNGK